MPQNEFDPTFTFKANTWTVEGKEGKGKGKGKRNGRKMEGGGGVPQSVGVL